LFSLTPGQKIGSPPPPPDGRAHAISNHFDKKYLLDSTAAGIYFRGLTLRQGRKWCERIKSSDETMAMAVQPIVAAEIFSASSVSRIVRDSYTGALKK
jgi:hypothetical protein